MYSYTVNCFTVASKTCFANFTKKGYILWRNAARTLGVCSGCGWVSCRPGRATTKPLSFFFNAASSYTWISPWTSSTRSSIWRISCMTLCRISARLVGVLFATWYTNTTMWRKDITFYTSLTSSQYQCSDFDVVVRINSSAHFHHHIFKLFVIWHYTHLF